jgi:Holliday junction resolvasome RuvABC endonuclease subunit|tara:strand:- start:263 stop:790 length:528 start_codon:yes stop_codon:yes gene_type:complete
MILGLDISTSITGYTVLDKSGKIVAIGHWDTRNKNKFPSLFSKSRFVKDKMLELAAEHDIRNVFIEPALNMFMMGKSSSHTISTLTKFNGIVSWICYEVFSVDPEYIPAISARKKCGISIKKGDKAKEQVMRFLLDNECDFSVEYTKNGNPKPHYYDEADSLVIARAGHKCLAEK